ncbi:MAG: hypothetical protein FWG87_14655 [Defluviitaleaceae bacterium]|nr:hypothetical protein [Defluviitaleaceae bacterium]
MCDVNVTAICRGRIYPSRGTHAHQFKNGYRPSTQNEPTSGRINPSSTKTLRSCVCRGNFTNIVDYISLVVVL